MPTRRGRGVAAGSLLALLGSWRLGYPELAVLGVAGLPALGAAALWLVSAGSLTTSREVAPPKAERGSSAIGLVRVENAGRRRSRAYRAVDRVGATDISVAVPSLPPGLARTVTYPIPTARRGVVVIGPLRLVLADPLGLFQRRRRCGTDRTLLVRPRVLASAPSASGRAASLDGPDSPTSPSGTVTFHSLRDYVFGDDLRHIHWRTTARLGTLMVRRLVDAGEPRTAVVLDPRAGVYQDSEAFELGVDVAASVAVSAARMGFPVTVLVSAERMSSVRGGGADADALLDWFALIEVDDQAVGGFAEVLRGLRRGAGHDARGALVVVTGDVESDSFERIAALSHGFDRTTVIRVGSGLKPPPDSATVRVVDVDSAESFVAAWRQEVRV